MSLNLATLLTESTKANPKHTAIIFDEFRMSYGELNAATNKFANVLKAAGIGPGQKVAIMLPNIPQFVICYYGILKTGATVVPLNVLLKAPEVAFHLQDSEAIMLVAWEGFAQEAVGGYRETEVCQSLVIVNAPGSQNLPEVNNVKSFNALMAQAAPTFDMVQTMPDDTAVILYTSGTTGRPKGAELTHFNMFFNARVVVDNFGLEWHPDDVMLVALPLFHAFGQSCVMNVGVAVGATLTLMARFDPVKAYEIIQRDKVTAFSGVPTMYFYLLNHPDRKKYDLSTLRICTSGGAAIPVEVLSAFKRETGVTILEGYGLSETSPVATFNVMFKPTKPGSIGIPIWGVECKIVDEFDNEVPVGESGELLIRGHNVMKGYLNHPEATAEVMRDDWFHSGDVAKFDEEGYIYIVDRKKDMIIRGGFNVYPREIEEVLYAHPAVAEAAVVGVPDPAMGEEVKAFVVLKPGATATEDEIREYCKARIASNKYPRIIEFYPEGLPKNATGKILKRELRPS
ncbi:MAG TPA: long-chain fatty acid--CoA ligase [Chloroflexia bacterium]|nr:long-chain fatty acid--CoA ligase [Chloroflexia bacterium]